MKLYLLARKDQSDWDQCIGFVVRAENEERALALCSETEGNWCCRMFFKDNIENIVIKELSEEGIEEVILDSFHAG